MAEKPILIIHPYDPTTKFLNRIKNHLISNLKHDVHNFNVKTNDLSHQKCLERINAHPQNGLIIFLGHGRSDKLYGSKGNKYESREFIPQAAIEENPNAYYYKDIFISEENCTVFSGKKIFCLACNSNSKIAEFTVNNGARSFLGFGDLPTSIDEFEAKGIKVSKDLVTCMKTELNYIIKHALVLSIKKGLTIQSLLDHIRFIASQRIADILINQKTLKERQLLADYLYYFKKEASIIGQKNLKLIE